MLVWRPSQVRLRDNVHAVHSVNIAEHSWTGRIYMEASWEDRALWAERQDDGSIPADNGLWEEMVPYRRG